jgi:uncharacterized membrane protein YuzA (DUF378 family)
MGTGNGLYTTALILLIIGGLNWGLIGLFGFNLVDAIFGTLSAISRIIYLLVGLSAIYVAVAFPAKMADYRHANMAHR